MHTVTETGHTARQQPISMVVKLIRLGAEHFLKLIRQTRLLNGVGKGMTVQADECVL